MILTGGEAAFVKILAILRQCSGNPYGPYSAEAKLNVSAGGLHFEIYPTGLLG
jgi:hypothetical protein